MAVIYSYPTKTNPVGSDLILISDSADSNKTKQVKVSSLPSSGGGSVSSVELSLSGIAAFAITGDNPITNSGTIILGTTGGSAGQFLDYQGNWSTPAGSGGSYTAGDGLQLNGAVFSTDLKENGGLVIETNELALDLAASSITGTLATSDGGTGSSNTEYCNLEANVTGVLPVGKGGTGVNTLGASRLILGNGANAVTSISSQTKGTIVVGNNTTTTILAVGTDGHVLTADATEATGIRWSAASSSPVTSYSNGIDNRVVTSTGANGINGESGLTYDGSALDVTGSITANAGGSPGTGVIRGTFKSQDNTAGATTTLTFPDKNSTNRTFVFKNGICTSAT